MSEINSHFLKVIGKAELPSEVKIGQYQRKCLRCSKEFRTFPKTPTKFCSMSCASLFRFRNKVNHPRWKKERKKCTQCGVELKFFHRKFCSRKCANYFRVKNLTGADKEKMSLRFSSINNPRWKGGITKENDKIRKSKEYVNWRNFIYKKDFWTCRYCGGKCSNGDIVAHHIMQFSEFPKQRLNLKNGITLHRSCHTKLHSIIKKYKHA